MQTRTRSYVYPLKHSVQKDCSGLLTSCITEPKESRNYCKYFSKITKIVRALWLVERRVCMRVCKHGCEVKMFCFSRANHASTNLKKFSSSKLDKFTLFTHSFVAWNMENRYKESESIFLRLSWQTFQARRIRILQSIFLQNKNWLRVQDFVDKILRLVRISLLIIAIQRVLLSFLGKVILQKQ